MKLFTQRGYDFYEVASALQKAIRRNDVRVAGYMALELFPRYTEYCWKRLLTISAEDCSDMVTTEIKSLYDSFWIVNKGKKGEELKGRIFISKAVIILCRCRHSRDADILSNFVYDKRIECDDEIIESYFEEVRKSDMKVPEYVYDCHTLKGKKMGKTKEQFFIEEEKALANKQYSMFDYMVLGDDK